MNYNSGNARRNFYAKWVKLREEYQAAGMKEDAIQKMYEYDLAVFNDDRAHHRYDVEIPNLHGLQRQRPQGRSADEVLKHIFSAKRHLQAAGASYYIIMSHYRCF